MMLGKYFTLDELIRTSHTAPNEPTAGELVNLVRLVALVLDPLRSAAGPLRVTSGYRSERINELVGGVPTSRHRSGCAADIVSADQTPEELVGHAVLLDLPYDKLIMEERNTSVWLHIQIAPVGGINRGELYKAEFDRDLDKMVYTRI